MRSFNSWYDRQTHTVRFAILMVVVALMAFPLQLGVHFGSAPAVIFGALMLVVVITLTAYRALVYLRK